MCYIMFKSKRSPLKFHPLVGRLVQYKQMLDEMEPVSAELNQQIEDILRKVKAGKTVAEQAQQRKIATASKSR